MPSSKLCLVFRPCATQEDVRPRRDYKLTPNGRFVLSQTKAATRESTDAIGDLILVYRARTRPLLPPKRGSELLSLASNAKAFVDRKLQVFAH
jgi:hypothetical protein